MKSALSILFFTGSVFALHAQPGTSSQSFSGDENARIQTINGVGPKVFVNEKTESVIQVVNQGAAYLEGPPPVKPGGWRSYYFSTHFTKVFSTPVSLSDDNLSQLNLSSAYGPTIVSSPLVWWNDYSSPGSVSSTALQWRRNYEGVTGVHAVNTSAKGNIIIAYEHGENKNEKRVTGNYQYQYYYQNTVWPEKQIIPNDPSTFSGNDNNNIYHECWDAYFGFVNMSWIEDASSTNWGHQYFWEQGPVAWPSNGYVTPGRQKASYGLRHPSSIVYNGYIYIYFLDSKAEGIPQEEGRYGGIKLARVPVNTCWNQNTYEIYYNGGWQPSLPAGYDRDNMMNFLDKKGPKSSVITGVGNTTKFSVARFSDDNYFIGMEEYIDVDNSIKVVFRLSTDLINWTAPGAPIYQNNSGWENSIYRSPIFLDKDGWSNSLITKDRFYVLGASSNTSQISRMKLNVDIVQFKSESGIKLVDDPTVYIETYQQNGILTVLSRENSSKKTASIYSIYGQLIKQQPVDRASEFTMDISGQAPGVYLLTLETAGNKCTQKIVIR